MQVKIGPSFFAKEKQEYSCWHFSWNRELCQNSFDVPDCSRVEFNFTFDGVVTSASCTNNGTPMDKETLLNKFLALGESGKNFQGTTGGFGAAKVLIAFCHQSYTIRTGTLLVTGAGGEFELQEGLDYFHGTQTTVVMAGDEVDKLSNKLKTFCAYAQWSGVVFLTTHQDGETLTRQLETNLKKGAPRRDLGFGTVYTNKSHENKLIVRINGTPMFWDWIDFNRCVILELKGTSSDVLTKNRDSLKYEHRKQLSDFIRELATDKQKALKNQQPKYQYFGGAKLSYRSHNQDRATVSARDLVGAKANSSTNCVLSGQGSHPDTGTAKERFAQTLTDFVYNPNHIGVLANGIAESEFVGSDVITSQIQEEFVILNELDLVIPDYYLPDNPSFGSYARKLARIWGRLLLELHKLFKHEAEFSLGFCFSDDSEALFEEGAYGKVYYLNPATVVQQQYSQARSLKKRFQLTERDRLLAIAVHEFTHGQGFVNHCSDYAAKLTDNFAVVMKNRKNFSWAFTD